MQFPLPNHSAQSVEYVDGWFKTNLPSKVLEYSEIFIGWSDDLTKIHDSLGDHPIDLFSHNLAIESLKSSLNKNDPKILEIGCSSGKMLEKLIHHFPEAKLVGADVVKQPLFELAEKVDIPLLSFDLLKNPLPSNIFDVVVILNVLEHIEDDLKALQNINNLLTDNGILIFEVPAFQFLYDGYDRDLCHFRRYSRNQLAFQIRSAGFQIEILNFMRFSIFLPFAIVKLKNKLFASNAILESNVKSSNNKFVSTLLAFEEDNLRQLDVPFGIRLYGVAKKIKELS